MNYKSYRSILGVFILNLIYAVANLTFHYYAGPVDFRISAILVGLNVLYLSIFLYVAFFVSMRYFNRVMNKAKLNTLLYDLVHRAASIDSFDDMYKTLLETAVKAIPAATKGSIMLLDEDEMVLRFAAAEGYDLQVLKETYLDLEDTYLYRESQGKITTPVIIDDPFGYDRDKINSQNMDDILSAGSANVLSTISAPIVIDGRLHGMINVDSPIRHVYTDADIHIIELFVYEITNVLKLYTSLEQNKYLSYHDTLTGVYNRSYVHKHILNLDFLSLNKPSSLISIDLNHLKVTNDTYGHFVGDLLLKRFVEGFNRLLPEDACFARYGGDEFIIYLQAIPHSDVINFLIDVKRWHRDHPVEHEGHTILVDFSFGITELPVEAETFEEALLIADQRMYDQKKYHHGLFTAENQ